MVVGLYIHEDEVFAVLVQVLHVTAVYSGSVNLEAGVEGLVYGLAREHVLELGTYESRTLTRLDVLELYYLPELALKVEYQAVL